MIAYNMRYRGPMEYDKFILNIFQYSNEINQLLNHEFYNSESQSNFRFFCEQINKAYETINQIIEDFDSTINITRSL